MGLSAPARPERAASRRRPAGRFTALTLASCALLLAGCEAAAPSVTWYGNRTAVHEGPALYCELTEQLELACSELDGPSARLALREGDPVQINIPADIASSPWWLVISYVGEEESFRTPLFTDGGTLSYVVRPEPGRQLKQVDLQVPTVVAGADGQPVWTPYQVWVLEVDPA